MNEGKTRRIARIVCFFFFFLKKKSANTSETQVKLSGDFYIVIYNVSLLIVFANSLCGTRKKEQPKDISIGDREAGGGEGHSE